MDLRKKVIARGICIVALTLVVCGAGCTKGDAVVVGSKDFTEQILLGEIVAQLLEARDVSVERRFNLGGTFICHQAIVSGELDVYVEYSGTAWTAILDGPALADRTALSSRLRERYASELGLTWGEPFGFDNSFAILMRRDEAARLGIRTISDLRDHQSVLRFAAGHEFLERDDGYPGLIEDYGLDFELEPRATGFGLMYQALQQGQVDIIAASATDGLIEVYDLLVLEDDRSFFIPYEASLVFRPEAAAAYPAILDVNRRVAGSMSRETMRRLNRRVDEGEDPRRVVRDFLMGEGSRLR